MELKRLSRRNAVALAVAALLFSGNLPAAVYPDKPVHVIVPFSTGGGTDIQARLLTEKLRESTGQPFIVDNRTGAGGLIGAGIAVESPADGYTILFTTATIAVNTTLYGKRMKFSATKDLTPVIWVSSAPLVLVVHPSVPAHSVKELVALAKRRPGFMNAAVNTPGSTSHLSAEMFKQIAKLDYVIVPFRGGGPATVAVVAGETDFLFATAPSAMPHIQSGRMRALAVTTAKRASVFPDLPTMSSFYPGFVSDNWYAMFFPKGVPQDKIAKMNAEIGKALNASDVKTFYARQGLDPVAGSPKELAALVKKEIVKYAGVIRKGHIQLR
jgi:tripartite-type tricarboxylate transporter receptor subunit TctC